MYEVLLQRLNHLVPLNSQQQQNLCWVVKVEEYPKASILLEKGQISDQIYFVVAGILRSYCNIEGNQVTRWFGFAGHFASAYFSFVYRQPSDDYLVLETDAQLLSISYDALQNLAHQDPVWIDLNRRLLEYYYMDLLERVMSFQTQSAAERYTNLLRTYPDIEHQVPLRHLASYLGMTPETLSRLRHKRKRLQTDSA
jgi:CRP-like cAMP-binding protein